ncbi:protein kinase [Thermopolyspora sp. NPDC052614]|uniref:serine/threonine-protein kinase n=1 Tax=Thermopolyspora sp. NPDC052614 TaxID=3155682 RepID=UPI00342D7A39
MDLGVRLADRYSLEERVASGGMAEVWRAWDEVLARTVAIKLVGASGRRGMAFRRRFRDEARSAAGLTHPRVVTIHDYGETEDGFGARTPYIVMEFLTGETLAERLTRGPLPVAEAARVCGQVAEALAAAHRAGIVHRDVKPANVFLTPDGVKVLDFGIARAMRGEPVFSAPFVWPGPWEAEEFTTPLDMAPYLAPEEDGDHAVEPSADVYALGVVLAESLTGRREPGAAMPPGVPACVADICARCRSADPRLRPSAAEVARTLANSVAGASGVLDAGPSVWAGSGGSGVPGGCEGAVAGSVQRAASGESPASVAQTNSPGDSASPSGCVAEGALDSLWPAAEADRASTGRAALADEHPAAVGRAVSAAERPVVTARSASAERAASAAERAASGRDTSLTDGPGSAGESPYRQSPPSGRLSVAGPGSGRPFAAEEVDDGTGARTSPYSVPIIEVHGPSESVEQEVAGDARGGRRPVGGLLAVGGLVLAVTALLVEVFVLMDPPQERRDLGARSVSAAAGQSGSGASSGGEIASGGAGAGMDVESGAGGRPGVPDETGSSDSAASPYPAGTAADEAGSTGPGSAAGTSPEAEPAATDRPRAAAETIRSLGQMASVVDQGFAAGEIRSDVAVDFNNLVTNLRNDLMTGSRVELGVRVADLRSKIYTRLREGALSHRYAEVLNDSLPSQVGE